MRDEGQHYYAHVTSSSRTRLKPLLRQQQRTAGGRQVLQFTVSNTAASGMYLLRAGRDNKTSIGRLYDSIHNMAQTCMYVSGSYVCICLCICCMCVS
jgi:hypothetical protein